MIYSFDSVYLDIYSFDGMDPIFSNKYYITLHMPINQQTLSLENDTCIWVQWAMIYYF